MSLSHITINQNSLKTFGFKAIRNEGKEILHIASISVTSRPLQNLYYSWMTTRELSYLSRIKSDQRRKQYILGRGLIKRTLSCLLKRHPTSIEIGIAGSGKPHLINLDGFRFSISHSGDYLAVVVSNQEIVGVDLEEVARLENPGPYFINNFLSSYEKRMLNNTDKDRQALELCRLWTLKEAILKAAGVGLNYPLSDIKIMISKNNITPDFPLMKNTHWRLSSWILNGNYVLSVAIA
jgi:4'-phosphopantetheinyl transferase